MTTYNALALFSILGLSVSTALAKDAQDVNVVNVPDVNVSNTPNVTVTNTPDVNVISIPEIKTKPEIVTPYTALVQCEAYSSLAGRCYFDVPETKVVHVEKATGYTGQGNVTALDLKLAPGYDVMLVTKTAHPDTTLFVFDADAGAYATDTDAYTDANTGLKHDFIAFLYHDGSGLTGGLSSFCTISGRLFDAATP